MPPPSPNPLNHLALHFKSLHTPTSPLLLTNVWDAHTAYLVASHASTTAIATASFAIAATHGIEDDDLTWETNKAGITLVARGIANAGKIDVLPLTVDLQDGYDDVKRVIKEAIGLGAVGANIEDCDNENKGLREVEVAVAKVGEVMEAAREEGVPDFVVNARTDVLGFGGDIGDVVVRGKRYLEAGATSVFVWGVRKWDITEEDVRRMSEAFKGRLAVQPGGIGIKRLCGLGVSRISLGPALWRKSMAVFDEGMKEALNAKQTKAA